jgi:hypothetical protein
MHLRKLELVSRLLKALWHQRKAIRVGAVKEKIQISQNIGNLNQTSKRRR